MDDRPLPVLPERLWPERDAAVAAVHASVHASRQALECVPGILSWLDDDGRQALASESGESVYAHLPRIGTRYFSDDRCREHDRIPATQRLTHAVRLRYARQCIRDSIDDDDGYLYLLLAAFRLRDDAGRDAVICGLFELRGKDARTHWSGVYRTPWEHATMLDRKGCMPLDAALAIPHFRLLSFWDAQNFDDVP